jgi:glucose/arabinose dehydrogenase
VTLFACAILACGLLGLHLPSAQASVVPSGFKDTVAFGNLEEPTAFRFAPNGKVFVAEKQGKILVYDGLGDSEPTVFADLLSEVYEKGDRGLLGLALDPEFPTRPYVYALYTYDHVLGDSIPAPRWGKEDETGDDCTELEGSAADACPVSGRLVRLTANGDHAVESGGAPVENVLVEDWCQQDSSHSIGTLEFGPEGALFAGGGDGASFIYPDYGQSGWPEPNQCGDPPGTRGTPLAIPDAEGGSLRAQNPKNLDGKIIRVDPDTGKGWPGNPMQASPNENERRVVALGMRNPYRFAVQPGTGEVYVGNVGNSEYEEIDRFNPLSGQAYNSGWPCFEGPEHEYQFKALGLDVCESLYRAQEEGLAPVSQPFFDYSHEGGVTPEDGCPRSDGSAISGLRFYDGEAFPAAYDGALFFSDTVRGCIYVMHAGAGGEPDPLSTEPFLTDGSPYPGIDIEDGPKGNLYYTSLYGPGYGPGAVHEISYDPGAPTARLSADPESGLLSGGHLNIHLDASESSDPENEPLSFEWDFNEDGVFEAGAAKETLNLTEAKNRTIEVRVSDAQGKKSVAEVTVYPGDNPPVATIESPDPKSLAWHVGQKIEFSGSAKDAKGNDLRYTHLYWHARLLHCPGGPEHCHAHPLQVFPGVNSGSFLAPDHDYPSSIELSLTATDERGLSKTTTVELDPQEVDLPVNSVPAGVTLSAGLLSEPGPFTLESIEGSQVQLSAPKTAEVNGTTYTWKRWSDGGGATHTVRAGELPEGEAYTATYTGPPPAPIDSPAAPGTKPLKPIHIGFPSTAVAPRLHKHPAKETASTTARFVFSDSQGGVQFRCKLDRERYRSCHSPLVYRQLKPGKHFFRLLAVMRSGERITRSFSWQIL